MGKTKKSLLFSGLALMMSALLLAGTTFAWFTDSVTNKGNTIQSGELQMDVYWFKWDVNEGKFVQTTMDNAKMSAENWEPGQSNAILMRLDNVGSLTSQVKLSFDVTEDTGLTDALWFNVIEGENYAEMTTTQPEHTKAPVYSTDTTVTCMSELESWEDPYQAKFTSVWPTDGKETEWRHWYLIEYGMYADAGNEYMNKTMTADIHLDVKQYTYEEDGFGNPNYDEDATFPEEVVTPGTDTAENGRMLRAALDGAKDGETVTVEAGTYSFDQALVINKEVKLVGKGDVVLDFSNAAAPVAGGDWSTNTGLLILSENVTLDGVTVIGKADAASVVTVGFNDASKMTGQVTLDDGTVYTYENGVGEFGDAYPGIYENVNFYNCTFKLESGSVTAGLFLESRYSVVKNCTFVNVSAGAVVKIEEDHTKVLGCTYIDCMGPWVEENWCAVEENDERGDGNEYEGHAFCCNAGWAGLTDEAYQKHLKDALQMVNR